MYLPNIIPSDIRTGWMQTSSDRRINVNNSRNESSHQQHQQQQQNMNSNMNMRSRKSDFPPLSFYTPIRSNPLYLTNTSKHALSFLQNSKRSYNYNGNVNGNGNSQFNDAFNSTYYEGIEQLGLELGCRLQTLKDNEIWGYTWLTPLGVDKTMAQLIEEANDEIIDNEDDHEGDDGDESGNRNVNLELQSAIDLVNDSANNIGTVNNNNINSNGSNSFDLQNVNSNNNGNRRQGRDVGDATDMMSENYGQMRRHDVSNEDSGSFNDNVSSRMNRAIYNNNNSNNYNDEGRMFSERDLDAEISNHDLSSSNIDYQGENSDDNDDDGGVIYGDEGDDENDDDIGDHAYIEDDDDDYDIADVRFAEDDDDNVEENVNEFNLGDQAIINLHDEYENDDELDDSDDAVHFHQILNLNQGSSSYPVNTGRTSREYLDTAEEGYFMAYEDYQDDHSIIDAQVGKPLPRNVSILENAHTRGSFTSVRRNMNSRYTDSANLTTPTTLNSHIGNQTTGNTSVDNDDAHGSDLDMTLE